jgi:PEP-CTERM motif
MMKYVVAFAASALVLGLSVPAVASVTVGQDDGGNCYPFSCFASDNGSTYQQVYDASEFSGVSTFNTVSFFRSIPGLMDTADYSISFYLTSAGPNGLSNTAASNRGTLLGNLGGFSVGGLMPSELSFVGNAFTYDSSAGNLLMEVNVLSLFTANRYQSFFQADSTTTTTARYFSYGNGPTGLVGGGGLVTRFDLINGAVPEPASWALMIAGFGLVGSAMRRRKPSISVSYA